LSLNSCTISNNFCQIKLLFRHEQHQLWCLTSSSLQIAVNIASRNVFCNSENRMSLLALASRERRFVFYRL
jgi:hypothetical protein